MFLNGTRMIEIRGFSFTFVVTRDEYTYLLLQRVNLLPLAG